MLKAVVELAARIPPPAPLSPTVAASCDPPHGKAGRGATCARQSPTSYVLRPNNPEIMIDYVTFETPQKDAP